MMQLDPKARLKLAASAVMLALGTLSFAPLQADAGDAGVNPAAAARSAEDAQRELARGRLDRAVTSAEAAVAADPQNPEHRALLARTYLSAGRYVSADESFDAALALGASDSRTIVGAAMALVANDRSPDALALLDRNAERLPASDYGLALALAGSAERAVMVLTDVARANDATARDRQNLALAYALAGRWLEARVIAAQDIGPAASEQRIAEWARIAGASTGRAKIAGLLGRDASDDPGMPHRLALDGHTRAPRLAASEDPAPLALYAPRAPDAQVAPEVRAQLAEATPPAPPPPAPALEAPPAPQPVATVALPAPAAMPAPTEQVASVAPASLQFVSNPVVQPLPTRAEAASRSTLERIVAAVSRPFRARSAPRIVAAVRLGSARQATNGRWSIQLAAFDRAGTARSEWRRLAARSPDIAARRAVTTRAVVRGRTFYRLSLTGFGSQAAAARACQSLARGRCFVRAMAPSETVLWASRAQPGQRLAATRTRVRVASR